MADNEKTPLDALDDEELTNLFSAFDDVRASDELKASTVDAILTQQATVEVEAFEGGAATSKPTSRSKAKLHVFRMIAIAACLAMALTGGAAYALPASHVKLSQGAETIDLGINFFGMTISASAAGDDQDPIQTNELTNKPYEESFAQAVELLDQRNEGTPIEMNIDDGDPARRQQMEDRGAQIMAERAENLPAEDVQPPSETNTPQNPAPEASPDQQPAGAPPDNNNPANPGEPQTSGSPNAPAPAPTEGAPANSPGPGQTLTR